MKPRPSASGARRIGRRRRGNAIASEKTGTGELKVLNTTISGAKVNRSKGKPLCCFSRSEPELKIDDIAQ